MHNGQLLTKQAKHVTVDGRLRGVPSEVRPFCLFFAVQRTQSGDKGEVQPSMTIGNISSEIEVTLKMPWMFDEIEQAAKYDDRGGRPNCGMPVMFNEKAVKAHARLVVGHDDVLHRLSEDEQKKRKADSLALAAQLKKDKEAKKQKV